MVRRQRSKDSRFSVRHAKRQRFFRRSGQSLRATPGILLWNSFVEEKQQAVEQASKQGRRANPDKPFATRNLPLWAPLKLPSYFPILYGSPYSCNLLPNLRNTRK